MDDRSDPPATLAPLDYGQEPRKSWRQGPAGQIAAFIVACVAIGILQDALETLPTALSSGEFVAVGFGLLASLLIGYGGFRLAWASRNARPSSDRKVNTLLTRWTPLGALLDRMASNTEVPRKWYEGLQGGLVGFTLFISGWLVCISAIHQMRLAWTDGRWLAICGWLVPLLLGAEMTSLGSRFWQIAARFEDPE